MDYANFWEKFIDSWHFRPDVEGSALIASDSTILKQKDFCTRNQRKILAACCASFVSIANNLILNTRLDKSDWIGIRTGDRLFVIKHVSDEFFLALLLRDNSNLAVLYELLRQLIESCS